MAKNPQDTCPKCGKSIVTDAQHFDGVPASPETMLRCILYQMYILASSALALKTSWQNDLIFQHPNPKIGTLTPCEPLKISALISFRILHGFLYIKNDDFSIDDFLPHGANPPTSQPPFEGFEPGKTFTRDSINKYIAHLTWARINKPHCIAQPKLKEADERTIRNARLLLKDAKRFVDDVCNKSQASPITPDQDGLGYRKIFDEALTRLQKVKV